MVSDGVIDGKGFVRSCMTVFGKYGGMVSGDDVAGTSPTVENTCYLLCLKPLSFCNPFCTNCLNYTKTDYRLACLVPDDNVNVVRVVW